MHNDTEGIVVDMEYTNIESKIECVNLNIHNILNGTVGQSVEVSYIIEATFAAYLTKYLEA